MPIRRRERKEPGNDVATPICNCAEPAVRRTIRKSGPKRGQSFFACAKAAPESCGYLLMENDQEPQRKHKKQKRNDPALASRRFPRGGKRNPTRRPTLWKEFVEGKQGELTRKAIANIGKMRITPTLDVKVFERIFAFILEHPFTLAFNLQLDTRAELYRRKNSGDNGELAILFDLTCLLDGNETNTGVVVRKGSSETSGIRESVVLRPGMESLDLSRACELRISCDFSLITKETEDGKIVCVGHTTRSPGPPDEDGQNICSVFPVKHSFWPSYEPWLVRTTDGHYNYIQDARVGDAETYLRHYDVDCTPWLARTTDGHYDANGTYSKGIRGSLHTPRTTGRDYPLQSVSQLDPSQLSAFNFMATGSFTLLCGGPGHGKSHTIALYARLFLSWDELATVTILCSRKAPLKSISDHVMDNMPYAMRMRVETFTTCAFILRQTVGQRAQVMENKTSDPHTLFICDEGGLCGTAELASVLRHTRNSQLILAGDPMNQLQPIAAGSPMEWLCMKYPEKVQKLLVNHRSNSRPVLARNIALLEQGRPPLHQGDSEEFTVVGRSVIEYSGGSAYLTDEGKALLTPYTPGEDIVICISHEQVNLVNNYLHKRFVNSCFGRLSVTTPGSFVIVGKSETGFVINKPPDLIRADEFVEAMLNCVGHHGDAKHGRLLSEFISSQRSTTFSKNIASYVCFSLAHRQVDLHRVKVWYENNERQLLSIKALGTILSFLQQGREKDGDDTKHAKGKTHKKKLTFVRVFRSGEIKYGYDLPLQLGYATICSLAIGLQWRNVFVFVYSRSKYIDRRFLYTAISRAKKRVVVGMERKHIQLAVGRYVTHGKNDLLFTTPGCERVWR